MTHKLLPSIRGHLRQERPLGDPRFSAMVGKTLDRPHSYVWRTGLDANTRIQTEMFSEPIGRGHFLFQLYSSDTGHPPLNPGMRTTP